VIVGTGASRDTAASVTVAMAKIGDCWLISQLERSEVWHDN
jgi:hypothetical protein